MYDTITFDLCDNCNAQCPYCQTGKIDLCSRSYKYLDVKEFKNTLTYLLSRNLYDKDKTPLYLYNWGEPTLHPEFKEILRDLRDYSNNVCLSSNLAKRIVFDPAVDNLSHIKQLYISMPGFSQTSYDKIHKFNIETVKGNISSMLRNMRDCGFIGDASIGFHLYLFNLDEYINALDFAIDNEIGISVGYAILADFYRSLAFFENKLPDSELKDIRKHLIYDPRYDEAKALPSGFFCNAYDCLVFDIDLNIITCCSDSTVYKKVYELDEKEVIDWRIGLDACKRCMQSGRYHYCVMPHKTPAILEAGLHLESDVLEKLFPKINDRIIQRMSKHKIELKTPDLFFESKRYKNIAIYGCGTLGKYLYSELKNTGINVICFIDNGPTAAESFDGKAVIKNDGLNKYAFDALVLSAQPGDYASIIKTLKSLTSAPIVKLTDILKFNDGNYMP